MASASQINNNKITYLDGKEKESEKADSQGKDVGHTTKTIKVPN